MSNVAKLKKQAAELELKKQFDKAVIVYVKLLESFDEHADELDVALFNRVGDLMLRQGNVADAVDYYEQAVIHYSEGGFFNNAIALCNKILRHSPGRASVYYRLGKISAQKGFTTDAKHNFLEYADRMQKSGKIDEAFRALKEFADLCPDQDDIRLMLADQLSKLGRKDEAVEQLQTLYERYDSEGRQAEATATAARMRSIDPKAEPRTGGERRKSSGADLVFLDLEEPLRYTPHRAAAPVAPPAKSPPAKSPPAKSTPAAAAPPLATPPAPKPTIEMDRLETVESAAIPMDRLETVESAAIPMDRLETVESPVIETPIGSRAIEHEDESQSLDAIVDRFGDSPDLNEFALPATDLLLGLESTQVSGVPDIQHTPAGGLLDLVPTSLDHTPGGTPTIAAYDEPVDGEGQGDGPEELDLIIPEPEPEAAVSEVATESLDFELSAADMIQVPPETLSDTRGAALSITPPAPTTPVHPSPVIAHSPLDGLPVVELDAEPPITMSQDDSAEALDDSLSAPGDIALGEAEEDEDEGEELTSFPTPSFAHRSTMIAAQSVEILKAAVQGEPEDWGMRRELAEAMLEAGDRAGGIRELEGAMAGAERSGNLDLASSLAEEIARLEPDVVRHHQKRVEFAFRTNDRGRLIEAYLALGDALVLSDQADRARTVYQRVLDLAPDDARARAALDTIVELEPEPPPPPAERAKRISGIEAPRRTTPPKGVETNGAVLTPTSAGFVNLGDWLRDEQAPRDTRMVVEEQEPSGDEEADFADMLRKFKQGVAENMDPEDYQSHYDLAIAFKEMGLLDEAIAEFQKALAGPANRLPTFEALGQCFLEKSQYKMASSILSRALSERDATEDKLVGVLYLLGRAAEAMHKHDEALAYYQRVFVLDIQFRDIADRISDVERAAR